MAIRVLLADDHVVFREGIRCLLESQRDMEVVGEASDGAGAVELAGKTSPDLLLIDVSMPGLNGIEAARRVVELSGDIKVLCLSMHTESRLARAMLEAGAHGYLLKSCPPAELLKAIRSVHL